MFARLAIALGFLVAVPVHAQESELDGVWRSIAYGVVWDVSDGEVTRYEETMGRVVATWTRPLSEGGFVGDAAGFRRTFERKGELLAVYTNESANRHFCRRIDELPEPLLAEDGSNLRDPLLSFDMFWASIDENYAFFDRGDVDWKQVRGEHRPRIDASTDGAALFEILVSMLEQLEDGHSSIQSTYGAWRGGSNHRLGSRINGFMELATKYYLMETPRESASGVFHVARLTPEIGYINIPGMAASSTQEEEAAAADLEDILRGFADCAGVVIDVRFNGGGWENLSRRIVGRFADEERVAFRTQARVVGKDEFTELQDQIIRPEGEVQWTKPAVLLTSRNSGSASEILTLCMRVLPHVTVVGEHTNGSLSTPLLRQLPIGIEFGFSNERYFTPEGDNHEKTGVPPDVLVEMTAEALAEDRDPVLEAAVDVLMR